MKHLFTGAAVALAVAGALAAVPISAAGEAKSVLTIDHFVEVKSTAPPIAGQPAVLYVRERRLAGPLPAPAALNGKVALFVHGAGTPAEVSFDVPLGDFSWMAFLARAGFDVFSVDMTGYGRSTRPAQMNDPCNLSADTQKQFVGSVIAAPCAPTFKLPTTTLASDWTDVGAAVDYVLALRHVAKVDLLAWSMGGPRAAGWAAEHPDKVNKMVLLAPAYNRGTQGGAAARGGAPAQGATGGRGSAPAQPAQAAARPEERPGERQRRRQDAAARPRSARSRARSSSPTGIVRRRALDSTSPRRGTPSGPTCWRPIRLAQRGAPACGARRAVAAAEAPRGHRRPRRRP